MTTSPSSNQNAFARLALAAAFAAATPLALVAPRAYAERQRGSQSDRRDDDNKGDRDKRDGRSRGHRDGGREDWGVGPFGPTWGGRGEQRPVSAPEWAEVSMFMQRFSPFRMGEVQRMPEGEWKERIKRGLAYRHRGLKALENKDPEGYEQRLAQLAVEDQVFKLMSQWGGADEARQAGIRDELRTQVARLVDLDLQERRRRVQRLEEELKQQRDDLDRDLKERDGLVDRRVGRFLEWASKWPPHKGKDRKGAKGEKGDAPDGNRGGAGDGKDCGPPGAR